MNVASLLNPPRTVSPSPSTLGVLRVEASVLAQALFCSARESVRDSVLAFRFMRGLLLNGAASAPLK